MKSIGILSADTTVWAEVVLRPAARIAWDEEHSRVVGLLILTASRLISDATLGIVVVVAALLIMHGLS